MSDRPQASELSFRYYNNKLSHLSNVNFSHLILFFLLYYKFLMRSKKQPLIILPLLFFLAHQLLTYQTLVTLHGDLLCNQLRDCKFNMSIGNNEAIANIHCGKIQTNKTFIVNEEHQYEKTDQHYFSIMEYKTKNKLGNFSSEAEKGVIWRINIEFQTAQGLNFQINHKQVQNEYTICLFYATYIFLALLSLPPGSIFYRNLEGMGIYNFIVSLHLSLAILLNLFVTTFKYIANFQFSLKDIIGTFIFLTALSCIFMHIFYKVKTFSLMIFKERSPKNALITFLLSMLICLMGIPVFITIHKNIFTFVYFASGLILYMCSFIVLKKMKKYLFSFRLVFLDSCTILFIGISSSVYPVMLYQIPNFYHIIGIVLMFSVLILNAGIAYILVNVIRKEIRQRRQDRKIKQNMNESKFNSTEGSLRENQEPINQRKMRLEQKVESEAEISLSNYSSGSSNLAMITDKSQE